MKLLKKSKTQFHNMLMFQDLLNMKQLSKSIDQYLLKLMLNMITQLNNLIL